MSDRRIAELYELAESMAKRLIYCAEDRLDVVQLMVLKAIRVLEKHPEATMALLAVSMRNASVDFLRKHHGHHGETSTLPLHEAVERSHDPWDRVNEGIALDEILQAAPPEAVPVLREIAIGIRQCDVAREQGVSKTFALRREKAALQATRQALAA